jgi:UDP-N-acetylglucosamine acyltransferase
VVGAGVRLGRGVALDSHVVVDGRTTVGDGTRVYPFVSIGLAPQDLKYGGEQTATEIGSRNQIREFVTIHRGTAGGGGVTRLGDDNLLMAQAHVAHDCQIGSEVIMANAATLAGHVEIADRANIGAYSGVHQFCRIGVEAFVGGYSVVVKDAPPYAVIQGNHAKCYGLNRVGMKRRGYSKDTIEKLHRAYHLLLSAKLNTTQAVEKIKDEITGCAEVDLLVQFIESSKRGVVK